MKNKYRLVIVLLAVLTGCDNFETMKVSFMTNEDEDKYYTEEIRMQEYEEYNKLCIKFGVDMELETKFIPDYYPPRYKGVGERIQYTEECFAKIGDYWISRSNYENLNKNSVAKDGSNRFIQGFIIGGLR